MQWRLAAAGAIALATPLLPSSASAPEASTVVGSYEMQEAGLGPWQNTQ